MLKYLVSAWVSFKLRRARKHWQEDKSLGLKLATINDLNTPQDVVDYLVKIVQPVYKPDPLFGLIDTQCTFLEFLAKRAGDCDDFQLQYLYLLFGAGLDPYYVTLVNRKLKLNHVICVVRFANRLWQLDTVYPTPLGPFNTLAEILDHYSRRVGSEYVFADVRDAWLRKADASKL